MGFIKGWLKSVRTNVVIGVVLVTPLVLTVVIVNFLFGLLTDWTSFPVHFKARFGVALPDWVLKVGVLLVVVAVLYLIGLLTRNVLGRTLYRVAERLITRIPGINRVYIFVRQIIESVFRSRQALFEEAVIVEYPRKGAYSVAFVTSNLPPKIAAKVSGGGPAQPGVCLFVPTTPNPTSGVLLLLPRAQLIPLQMSVADAMKLVMSGGSFVAGDPVDESEHSLLDLLQGRTHTVPESTKENDPHAGQ
ncbi:MAG: DUF502 domain-containing protein [Kiritimatiellae bacterium]|nr:DUF502 domain-containing protein [Kiritimatiellia bacterium]